MAHQVARLNQAAIQLEVLDDHGAGREIPVIVGIDRNRRAVGQPDVAVFLRTVGPERRVDVVRNESAIWLGNVARTHTARCGQQVGHGVGAASGLHELQDAATAVIGEINLAVLVDAEGRRIASGIDEFLGRVAPGAVGLQCPDAARREVAEYVAPLQTDDISASVDMTARDGDVAVVVVVFGHRVDERATAAGGFEVVGAFAAVPAVVATEFDQVHFLPGPLANVTQPQVPCRLIEAPAPRIAQTPRENLRAVVAVDLARVAPGLCRKRVGGRDVITGARADHVDAQHRPEQVGRVLAGFSRIAATAAVAQPDVQHTVRAERDIAAVVIGGELVDLDDDLFDSTCARGRNVVEDETRNDGTHGNAARTVDRVIEKYLRDARVVGVECHAQQSTLGVAEYHAGHVEEIRHGGCVVRIEHHHQAQLAQHEPAWIGNGLDEHLGRRTNSGEARKRVDSPDRTYGRAVGRHAGQVVRPRVEAACWRRRWGWWRVVVTAGAASAAACEQRAKRQDSDECPNANLFHSRTISTMNVD